MLAGDAAAVKKLVLGAAAVAFYAAGGQHAVTSGGSPHGASAAIAYAGQQLGKPYLWGGTGPDSFDCSGLVMMAYRSAGINIERTSQAQWASERQVPASQVQPGDLVFFAGGDGTVSAPGHVGLVTGSHQMIEAYGRGYPVRYSTFGLPSSPPGDTDPVGFTARPRRRGRPDEELCRSSALAAAVFYAGGGQQAAHRHSQLPAGAGRHTCPAPAWRPFGSPQAARVLRRSQPPR